MENRTNTIEPFLALQFLHTNFTHILKKIKILVTTLPIFKLCRTAVLPHVEFHEEGLHMLYTCPPETKQTVVRHCAS